jgi:hypothetical protein
LNKVFHAFKWHFTDRAVRKREKSEEGKLNHMVEAMSGARARRSRSCPFGQVAGGNGGLTDASGGADARVALWFCPSAPKIFFEIAVPLWDDFSRAEKKRRLAGAAGASSTGLQGFSEEFGECFL